MKIINPFYDAFLAAGGEEDTLKAFMFQRELTHRYAWSIPSAEIAPVILQSTPKVVEIGAGTGYWAWYLSQYGLDVVAYDASPYRNHWHPEESRWFEVQRGGVSKAGRHADRALLLCWPPYNRPMAYHVLRAYKGDTLIYVGEGSEGCTGDARFHETLAREWEQVWSHWPPNWFGIHSEETIWRRK